MKNNINNYIECHFQEYMFFLTHKHIIFLTQKIPRFFCSKKCKEYTSSCWKVRFHSEVCSCSNCPTEAMLWIKEVEMVDSVDDLGIFVFHSR